MDMHTKGSEWRKWDLQVHTPASVLNNNFGSDWDTYVHNLFTVLIKKEIAVVGITDYFTIDGFKKIKNEYLENEAKLQELFSRGQIEKIKEIRVIPNVEFRTDIFVGPSSVNFHIVFSEATTIKDIEEKFLHEIDFVYQGEPQSEDKKWKLRETNLNELGARLKEEHAKFQSKSDLFVGMMNAVVDHKQVSKILANKKNIFGGEYVFIAVADEDLSDISWDSMDHLTRKVLIQKADLLFTSNENTRKWALGQPPYHEGYEKFVREFQTLKPCVHGSDAHDFNFIGHPCAKRGDASHDCEGNPKDCDLRFCWIKADPTFEGLKQVLYEPEDRVRIQGNNPAPIKSSQTIFEFRIENSELEPELSFEETTIHLNEGFVAVTGGKGSGKTALVDLIAHFYEDRAFCDDKNSFVKRITENKTPKDLEPTIKLLGGQEYKKEIKEPSFIEGVSIVYVAQGELEKHVEDPAHLETYISNLIFESNELKDSELLFDYENINGEISELNEKLQHSNRVVFNLENETEPNIEDEFKRESKQLDTVLKDTTKKIDELGKSLSPEKVQEAEDKQKQLTKLRDRRAQLTDLGLIIKETLKFVDEDVSSFNTQIVKLSALAKQLDFTDTFSEIKYGETEKLRTLITTVRGELRKTIGGIEKFQKDLEEKEKGIKEHAKLLDKKKELEKAIHQIGEKLKALEEKKGNLGKAIGKRKQYFEVLLNKKIEQREKYLELIAAFAANKNEILKDLVFTAELIFDCSRFVQTMTELVDLRKIRIKGLVGDESEIAFFTDAATDLATSPTLDKVKNLANQNIDRLLLKIVPNQKRAETISRLTIYDSIFADYFNVMPSVKYKKVKLMKLSLGQKATVLIKIYLAQGENPIVIDSHDDHLDNEFIMEELVRAIRQAKQYRQVIIVSNNGNVVVNSDAEQVIIARRDDQGKISYIAGSLENPALRPKLLCVLEGGKEAFSKRQRKYRLHP